MEGAVIHCTGRGGIGQDWSTVLQATINWFANSTSNASAHFVIDRDGTIHRCVPVSRVAWHAGVVDKPMYSWMSEWNPNQITVGIELLGDTVTPYEMVQYQALAWLLVWLKRNKLPLLKFDTMHLIPHSLLYTQRTDPGPLFNWLLLSGLIEYYEGKE